MNAGAETWNAEMLDDFMEGLAGLHYAPWLQALLAALATYILEDPATVGSAFLVGQEKMAYWPALLGLCFGVCTGDLGLYALGRFAGRRVLPARLLADPRLLQAESWFGRNVFFAMAASRMIPGMRLPAYTAAGLLRVDFRMFFAADVALSVLWTWALFTMALHLGEAALSLAGEWRWPLAAGLVALAALAQWLLGRRMRRRSREELGPSAGQEPAFSPFELWPGWLFYTPVFCWCLLLGVRRRSLTALTAANPSIAHGGLIMESKAQIFSLAAQAGRPLVLPWTVFIPPPRGKLWAARAAMRQAGLGFPLVAKPDVGQRGAGVRPAQTEEELADYLEMYPAGAPLMLQQKAPYKREAGVFYYRFPSWERGRIFSVTRKLFPAVVGDGETTLRRLIERDPRARRLTRVYFPRFADRLDTVPAAGERIPLVFSGSHCRGAVFRDGKELASPQLLDVLDRLAQSMEGFYIGRFDIRYASDASLRQGRNLAVVEINGAGAEATHIWDSRMSLGKAWVTLFRQYELLYAIGAANMRLGATPSGLGELARAALQYRSRAKTYPLTM